jgi:hypothetical protein
MTRTVDADEQGAIHLSAELSGATPHARYEVVLDDGKVVLRLLDPSKAGTRPLWERLTPAERIENLRQWLATLPPSEVSLSDEALRRENLYED